MSRWRRVGDAVMAGLIRLGAVPHCFLLTTRGRITGKARTNPVTIVEHGERRWLVAPYGTVSWVHNARAAGRVRLSRGRTTGDFLVRETTPAEAGPILKEYLAITRPPRAFFAAAPGAPVEAFVAEAARHPVFELTPTG
jgi:deazaflavin-dependent oxidoreductase (nitroreductase family)